MSTRKRALSEAEIDAIVVAQAEDDSAWEKPISARKTEPPLAAVSLSEIRDRFQSEWVLLADPETDESLDVKGGTLLWHSKDRDEVYRKALELRPRYSAILYLGQLPEGTVVVL